MYLRPKILIYFASAAIVLLPCLAQGQVIWSDSDFMASNYTTSFGGDVAIDKEVRFNMDYSSFLPFDPDTFTQVNVPPSPRGGGSTTGVYMAANNNSLLSATKGPAMVSISPLSSNVNVGTGTANPNYVMRVDVFHSTGAGIDNSGTIDQTGTTNYTHVGINQANTTTLQLADLINAPASGSEPGQGLGISITADGGATDDYNPMFGGARYFDRAFGVKDGQLYTQDPTTPNLDSGLISKTLANYWVTQGFEFDPVDADPNNNLNRVSSANTDFSPDPTDVAGYLPDGSGSQREVFLEAFPQHDETLHYSGGGVTLPSTLAPNTAMPGGVPYNKWATHELYWVDGTFTYAITYDGNTIPVLQITPDNDGLNGDDNIYSAFSSAGTGVLAFWDRFSSVATSPDGANFAIYDNLEFEVASAGDVPGQMAYLAANGFLLSTGAAGDFDGDGDADGNDFLIWQRGNSPSGPLDAGDLAAWQGAYGTPLTAAANAVPEPSSALLLLGLAGYGYLGRRRC